MNMLVYIPVILAAGWFLLAAIERLNTVKPSAYNRKMTMRAGWFFLLVAGLVYAVEQFTR